MTWAFISRGDLYARNDKPEKALADFDSAIDLDPDFAEAYAYRGIFYSDMGDVEQAVSDIEKALE